MLWVLIRSALLRRNKKLFTWYPVLSYLDLWLRLICKDKFSYGSSNTVNLTLCMLGNFACFFCHLWIFFFFLINFFQKNLLGIPSVSNNLDSDQAGHFVYLCWGFTAQSTHGVMSSAVSLPSQYCAHSFARNWQLPFLNQQKEENDRRKYFMINLHERMLPTSVGVEPTTSWSPVGRHIQLNHRGRLGHFVGPDLGPNCLQWLSADDKSWH